MIMAITRNYKKSSASDEQFIAAIKGAVTYKQIWKRLGLSVGNNDRIRSRMEKLGIESPTLVGRAGVSHQPRALGFYRKELEELTDAGNIKQRLIRLGLWKNECSRCHLTTWLDESITLELDHIDGDNKNNVINNLRLLCPNCHSLTPTWKGRNTARIKQRKEKIQNGKTGAPESNNSH